MEIRFEQVKLIEQDLRLLYSKYETVGRVLAKEKKVENCITDITRMVGDIVMDSSLCYFDRDNTGFLRGGLRTFRVFNGRYYEQVNERFVCQGMKEFLEMLGISPLIVLRLDKRINDTVVTYCLGKILKPRMTLMCFKNGVVDFALPFKDDKYPELKEFSREYDVIKQYDFNYNTRAHRKCTLWKDFLGEPYVSHRPKRNMMGVLPERIKRQQLQMFLGSCLMDRSEHSFEYFMILQGDGANGKSVIFRVLRDLFGREEVSPIDLSQFSKVGDEKLRAAATLEGKRLMFCPEENIKSAKTFNFIKQLASGESMSARKIGGNIGEVESPPILMLNTNHKWTIGDFVPQEDMRDKSMLRRVQIINFEHSIPVAARDTNLSRRLSEEKEGIFSWILLGFVNLKKNRYRMPESMQDRIEVMLDRAKKSIKVGDKDVNGSLVLYLERKGMHKDEGEGWHKNTYKTEDIYKNYCHFCENEGLEPISPNKFGRDMNSIGFERWKNDRSNGGDNKVYYHFWIENERIADNFLLHVPTLVDEADCLLFEGEVFDADENDDGSAYVD